MLGFIEKLTLHPEKLGPADADAVRATGVSDDAIVDAIHVAALFNMIDRMADSLNFDVPPYESFLARADTMLAEGYLLYALPGPADDRVLEDPE
jgi:hypothetical protein